MIVCMLAVLTYVAIFEVNKPLQMCEKCVDVNEDLLFKVSVSLLKNYNRNTVMLINNNNIILI